RPQGGMQIAGQGRHALAAGRLGDQVGELFACEEVGPGGGELHTEPSCPTSTVLATASPDRSVSAGATTASNSSCGTAARASPARSRARARYAGSVSTTVTSKPASRIGVA